MNLPLANNKQRAFTIAQEGTIAGHIINIHEMTGHANIDDKWKLTCCIRTSALLYHVILQQQMIDNRLIVGHLTENGRVRGKSITHRTTRFMVKSPSCYTKEDTMDGQYRIQLCRRKHIYFSMCLENAISNIK